MIIVSGKVTDAGRAYALIIPEISGECPESIKFGFLPDLAKALLSLKGWLMPGRDMPAWVDTKPKFATPDEIHAMCEALLDPRIDCWGCKIVSAETRIAHEYAYVCDLEDVEIYYDGIDTNDYGIREAVSRITDQSIRHAMLDCLVEYDRNLDAPGLVRQIHKQIDE